MPERARVGLAVLFGVNGASFATVLPRYPGLKDQLGLSNAEFGMVIAAGPLGALVLGTFAGIITARWGSSRVAAVASAALGLNLVLVSLAPSVPFGAVAVLAVALCLGGALDTVADVAENTQAMRVQSLLRRSVLNSLHGAWSVGAVVGGIAGSAAAGADVPLVVHLGGWAVVVLVLVAASSRWLLAGPEPLSEPLEPAGRVGSRWAGWLLLLIPLGMVAASANLVEDAASTWGAIYLTGLGAGAATAGLGFVVLQAMQILGRLTGDLWVTRFGDRAVARAGGLLVLLGGLLVVGPATVTVSLIGFGLAGLGVATLIPAAMRAAANMPGLSPTTGLTVAGTVLRIGLLASPPAVGLVADATSLRIALLVIALSGVVVLVLSGRLRGRPRYCRSLRGRGHHLTASDHWLSLLRTGRNLVREVGSEVDGSPRRSGGPNWT